MCNCTLFLYPLGILSGFIIAGNTAFSDLQNRNGDANRYLNAAGISFSRIANLIIVSPGSSDIQKLKAHLLAFFYDYKKYFLEDTFDNQIVIISDFDLTNSMDAALFVEFLRCTNRFDPKATFFMNEGSKDIAALKKNLYGFPQKPASLIQNLPKPQKLGYP
ncbi:MAG: hypothetical protein V8Q36_03305 [Anaerotignum sp.]